MVVHRKPKTEQDAAMDAKRAIELYRYKLEEYRCHF